MTYSAKILADSISPDGVRLKAGCQTNKGVNGHEQVLADHGRPGLQPVSTGHAGWISALEAR